MLGLGAKVRCLGLCVCVFVCGEQALFQGQRQLTRQAAWPDAWTAQDRRFSDVWLLIAGGYLGVTLCTMCLACRIGAGA